MKTISPIGERVRQWREELGLSQPKLANRAGLSVGFIRDLEQGRRKAMQNESAVKLAMALEVTVGQLFGTEEDETDEVAEGFSEVPLLGVIGGGCAADNPFESGATIRGGSHLKGTVCYRVRGSSMQDVGVQDGDYVFVRENPAPKDGETVVVWLSREDGCVVKKYDGNGWLVSKGVEPWSYMLGPGDRIFGVLVELHRRFPQQIDRTIRGGKRSKK